MIAVDTSALIAILFREPEAEDYAQLIQANGRALVGAPTALEFRIVARRQVSEIVEQEAALLLRQAPIEIVDWSVEHAEIAHRAYAWFGKAPARLNFGDCMTYAVAKRAGCPLLFKGDDFWATDLQPVAQRSR